MSRARCARWGIARRSGVIAGIRSAPRMSRMCVLSAQRERR